MRREQRAFILLVVSRVDKQAKKRARGSVRSQGSSGSVEDSQSTISTMLRSCDPLKTLSSGSCSTTL